MQVEVVQRLALADVLLSEYLRWFVLTYQTEPHIDDNDRQTFIWLAGQYPKEKAVKIVEYYFRLKDPYVLKNVHSVRLLKTTINQILVTLPNEDGKAGGVSKDVFIDVRCDLCGRLTVWTGKSEMFSESDEPRHCQECKTRTINISELETKIVSIKNLLLSEEMHLILKFSLLGDVDLAARMFGVVCQRMITKKHGGQWDEDLDWDWWCNFAEEIAYFLTQARLNKF